MTFILNLSRAEVARSNRSVRTRTTPKVAAALLALGILGGCSKTPADNLSRGKVENVSTPIIGVPASVEEQAQAVLVETLGEVSQPDHPYALKQEVITAAQTEGLELSEEEWMVLQSAAVPAQ